MRHGARFRLLDAAFADLKSLFDRAGASPAEHAELEALRRQERERIAHDQGDD